MVVILVAARFETRDIKPPHTWLWLILGAETADAVVRK
jgi:hypothetical protein